jgi:hypothetical protein
MPRDEILAFWSPLRDAEGLPMRPSCERCAYLGSDDDGNYPEVCISWPVCDKHESYSRLKSFPFKSPMPCFLPNFWHSEFASMINARNCDSLRPADLFRDFLRSHGLSNGFREGQKP